MRFILSNGDERIEIEACTQEDAARLAWSMLRIAGREPWPLGHEIVKIRIDDRVRPFTVLPLESASGV